MYGWPTARSAVLATLFLLILLAGCSADDPGRHTDPRPSGPGGTAPAEPPAAGGEPPAPGRQPGAPGGAEAPDGADPVAAAEARQARLERLRALLRQGRMERHVPDEMRQDRVYEVRVRVSAGHVTPGGSGPDGEIEVDPVLIGSDLVAELSGPDFDIQRAGNDDGRRILTGAGYAEWLWHVRPRTSGDLSLQVVLFVRFADSDEPPLNVQAFSETVEVGATPWQAVMTFFQTYGAATGLTVPVIVGAVIAVVRWVRRRRGPERDDAAQPGS